MKSTMQRRAREAYIGILYLLSACGAGCGTTLPTKPIADARKLVDATDPYVADIDRGMLAIEPVLIAACTGTEPLLPADKCGPALKGYDAMAVGLDKAQTILVQVDAALAVIEAVAEAAQ